jgi:hypothetical protein
MFLVMAVGCPVLSIAHGRYNEFKNAMIWLCWGGGSAR